MGTPNVIVGSTQAACLMQNNHEPIVISNDGPDTVYLDDAPSVNPLAYDYALQPGDCVAWIENVPCYAICANLKTASVTISLNVRIFGGVRLYSPTGVQAVISGGTVSTITGTDGNQYQLNKFTTSSSLACITAGQVRVLVAAAGGGSGSRGGGGGGGYIDTVLDLTPGIYPATVGTGGIGAADTSTNGGDSRFGPLTALGGGGGGGTLRGGLAGGSGGGPGQGGGLFAGAANIASYGRQGYDGAAGILGGGGGGANGSGGATAGGPGIIWIDGIEYCAGGATAPLIATPANRGLGANVYNTNGGTGVVIIATRI
jgi:hypothetical protein